MIFFSPTASGLIGFSLVLNIALPYARSVWHELWRISRACFCFVIRYSWQPPWVTWGFKTMHFNIICYTLQPRMRHSLIHPKRISLLLPMKRHKGKIWLVLKGAKYLTSTRFNQSTRHWINAYLKLSLLKSVLKKSRLVV